MVQVLHILQQVFWGGGCRCMIGAAKYTARLGSYHHRVLGLMPPEPAHVELVSSNGIECLPLLEAPAIKREIEKADIVHVHWWNNPQLNALLRSELPPMRLVVWFHIAGDRSPQVVSPQIVELADVALAGSPYTYECEALQSLSPEVRREKAGMAYGPADFERLYGFVPKAHGTFNVGYIGSLDFHKMHRGYVRMSARADIPDVRFILCGKGEDTQTVLNEARACGAAERFDYRGYVEDIRGVLEEFDLYGYPLCEDTYAASELNLQEAMYCGVVPVVFPHGGIRRLVQHNETGYVVESEQEYTQALEHLYRNPAERQRLSENARKHAREVFGGENAGRIIHDVYQRLLQRPKEQRFWGVARAVPVLDQPLTLSDLLAARRVQSGADIFVESLVKDDVPFRVSMTADEPGALFEAEQRIAGCSELMRNGGIRAYRQYYRQDPDLALWYGLALLGSGAGFPALAEFIEALRLGRTHWRVVWYACLAAVRAGQREAAVQLLQQLSGAVDFEPAKRLLQDLSAGAVTLLDCSLADPQWTSGG